MNPAIPPRYQPRAKSTQSKWPFADLEVGGRFEVLLSKRNSVAANICKRNKQGGAQYCIRTDDQGRIWCYRSA
jgi:hypothetical protein